jgi:hypothetical protein
MGPSLRIPGVPTFPAKSRSGILGIRRIPEDEVGPEWNPNPEFTSSSSIGGPVEKMSFFQIVHMTKVSTQIHSSISQYDVYEVSSKKIDHNLTVGCLND